MDNKKPEDNTVRIISIIAIAVIVIYLLAKR